MIVDPGLAPTNGEQARLAAQGGAAMLTIVRSSFLQIVGTESSTSSCAIRADLPYGEANPQGPVPDCSGVPLTPIATESH